MATRIILFMTFIFFIQSCSSAPPVSEIKVQIGNETFLLEVAVDSQTRAQGLMHRTEIHSDGGMIFIFTDTQERSFWMKNCLVDIDIVFLDSRGTVTAVHTMLAQEPKRATETVVEYEGRLPHYWSHGPARFAIELASGSFERLHIKVNDRITLDLPTLKGMAR